LFFGEIRLKKRSAGTAKVDWKLKESLRLAPKLAALDGLGVRQTMVPAFFTVWALVWENHRWNYRPLSL